MHYPPEFYKELRNKLSTGDRRSIQINAAVNRAVKRMDILDLDKIEPGLADKIINNLHSQESWSIDIKLGEVLKKEKAEAAQNKRTAEPAGATLKRLIRLATEAEEIFRDKGVKTFALGYPMLIHRDREKKKLIASPLVIWRMELKRKATNNNNFELSVSEDQGVEYNEVLANTFLSKEGIQIPPLNKNVLENKLLDEPEMQDYIRDVARALQFEAGMAPHWHELNDTEAFQLDPASDDPIVVKAGVFGLYSVQKQALLEDYDKLAAEAIKNKEFTQYPAQMKEPVRGIGRLDPTQSEALRNLATAGSMVIQGPPGTGKSQTLFTIITAALSAQKTILMVCEKKTAMDVIYDRLRKEGLDEFAVIVEDPVAGRKSVVENARKKIDNPTDAGAVLREIQDADERLTAAEKSALQKDGLQREHRLGALMARDVVTMMLEALRQGPDLRERLFVNTADYQFTEDERRRIADKLAEAERYYRAADVDNATLQAVSPALWQLPNGAESRYKIREESDRLTNECRQALSSSAEAEKNFRQTEKLRLQQALSQAQGHLAGAQLTVNEMKALYPGGLPRPRGFLFSLAKLFSAKAKKLAGAEAQVHESMRKLSESLQAFTYMNAPEAASAVPTGIESLDPKLQAVENELARLQAESGNKAEEYTDTLLTGGGILPAEAAAIKNALRHMADEISKATLLTPYSTPPADNIAAYRAYINDFLKQCEGLEAVFSKIEAYWNWRNLLLGLTPQEKELVDKLITLNVENWRPGFIGWYLNRVLSRENKDRYVGNSDHLVAYDKELAESQKGIYSRIRHTLRKERNQRIHRRQSESLSAKDLYALRGGSRLGKPKSLRQIVQADLPLFQALFPVVMTTPEGCSQLFEMKEGMFDLVIFDEASQLRLEDTFPAFLRGKAKVISGDSQQMPPSSYFSTSAGERLIFSEEEAQKDIEQEEEEQKDLDRLQLDFEARRAQMEKTELHLRVESLLEYAGNLDFIQKTLKIHYRSAHPALIGFSNAAYYKGELQAVAPNTGPQPFAYHFVAEGENRKRRNQPEAARVVQVMKDIPHDENGMLPSVGIATFNIEQKGAILDAITEEEMKDEAFARRMQEWRAHEMPFFIKNLENIQGDERDVIIMSTSYAPDADGRLKKLFGALNLSKGYRLFNVIITRARKQIILVTSIPERETVNWRNELEIPGAINGRASLYAYIQFVKLMSEGNNSAADALLKEILEHTTASDGNSEARLRENLALTDSVFEEEVLQRLVHAGLPVERIKPQYPAGVYRIDLMIMDEEGKPMLAIECDGAAYHSSAYSFLWDRHRQSIIEEKYRYPFVRIWSTGWWEDEQREINALMQVINAETERKRREYRAGRRPQPMSADA